MNSPVCETGVCQVLVKVERMYDCKEVDKH